MEMQAEDIKTLLGMKQEESLKIEKNSRGVNWEYKLLGNVENSINTRVDNIEKELKKRFVENDTK